MSGPTRQAPTPQPRAALDCYLKAGGDPDGCSGCLVLLGLVAVGLVLLFQLVSDGRHVEVLLIVLVAAALLALALGIPRGDE